MNRQYLITSVCFDNSECKPTYQSNLIMNENELAGTDYKLPRKVGTSITRLDQAGRTDKFRLTIETITRIQ